MLKKQSHTTSLLSTINVRPDVLGARALLLQGQTVGSWTLGNSKNKIKDWGLIQKNLCGFEAKGKLLLTYDMFRVWNNFLKISILLKQ